MSAPEPSHWWVASNRGRGASTPQYSHLGGKSSGTVEGQLCSGGFWERVEGTASFFYVLSFASFLSIVPFTWRMGVLAVGTGLVPGVLFLSECSYQVVSLSEIV